MALTPFASINTLLQLAGAVPSSRRSIEWPAVHRQLGSVLPIDYRQLIEFGPVRVSDFLTVFAPGTKNPNADLFVAIGDRLGALRELKPAWGCPYPLWFEPEGLLPWGASDNGDTLYWLTRGHPDQWTVVVGEARGPKYEEYALPMSDFLVAFISGPINSTIFGKNAHGERTVTLVGEDQ